MVDLCNIFGADVCELVRLEAVGEFLEKLSLPERSLEARVLHGK
jgi:hypothetical protein